MESDLDDLIAAQRKAAFGQAVLDALMDDTDPNQRRIKDAAAESLRAQEEVDAKRKNFLAKWAPQHTAA